MTNFFNLVLIGYFNEDKYLEEYFLREQRRVKEDYKGETFFSKCLDVVQEFKDELDRKKHLRKMEIFHTLQNFSDPEKHQIEIKRGYKDIEELKREDFSIELFSYFKPPIFERIDYGDILEMETSILKAIDSYNLELDFEELQERYSRAKKVDILFPFTQPLFTKDNLYKWKTFLNSSLNRFCGIVPNLPGNDQIQLKDNFQLYFDRLTEGAGGGDYKGILISQIKLIEVKYQLIKEEVKPNVPQFEKIKTLLEDFFTENASPKLIDAIQESFKELNNKETAALVYLLDFKGLIIYDNSIKPKSRLNFVKALKNEKELNNIWGINKFFQRHSNDTTLIDPKGRKDKTLIIIEEQLAKVVDSC